jgi:hypothetical protein
VENKTKSKGILIVTIVLVIIVIAAVAGWMWFSKASNSRVTKTGGSTSTSFNSYKSLKGEVVKIATPEKFTDISSPLEIRGEVKGSWSFEASFVVVLKSSDGSVLAKTPARLTGDWMTTNYVPFTVTLNFDKPVSSTGTLILQKDNPSGDPAKDDSVQIPVTFK